VTNATASRSVSSGRVSGGSVNQHPSTWGNPRAEDALRSLRRLDVPEVPARVMRRRLRKVPPAVAPGTTPPPASQADGRIGGIPVRYDPPPPPPLPQRPARTARGRARQAAFADPHDWRWVVGGVGRVLVSVGLLIFAFVAYQLWGTGIQYARAQDQLRKDFSAELAQHSGRPGTGSTLAGAAPTTVVPGSVPGSSDPAATVAPVTPSADPTVTTVAGAPTTLAELPALQLGDALGIIEIPKIGVNEIIVAGVRQTDLDKGVGHYPYTPLPGNPGNAAIAGHRTTHGQPFFNLDKLVAGDQIIVTTLQGKFVYDVTGSKVVDPTDFTVLFGDPSQTTLTLTTCHPRFSQKKRLVISAVFDPTQSQAAGGTLTYAPQPGDLQVPSDSSADTIAGENGAPVATDATGSTVAGSDSGSGATGGVSADAAPATETKDAFASGWFSDPEAWPQIALWGFALTAVALFATWLGKRRANWIGALVGIAPFVVLLYFWFENVNRLLPPGL